ncbi:hypothetical protein, variant [Exophiala xenobiotica]|uniref:aldehyde dehydrogenase (NAD(+)) n=1 Tax=Exophiala xenobiotica TaxID=348802 RepID=A0A0D2FL51_9EURO|nr:hypothetical protein, variant [Exophiala xenobiotica]XP_013321458.1 uncharacterized protein PV05_01056 [Exophiala xenobiotica]KIW60873.1 hypothetical protein PV05_01056 [Exophiala xenobiotica]KIW60874.1 hypothetical protein, variant [Exophiala xenobiotica]
MLKYADLVEQHSDKISHLESISMGQPIWLAKAIVGMQVASWRYYAGFTDKIPGETYPENGDGFFKMVNYEPLGVCAGISAWNGTQFSVARKIAPAVAVGNTYIFKSSEKSPLGVLYLGKLFKEAGFPPGVVNLLSGSGRVGALLASHMDIAHITFTGSAAAGRQVQIAAAKSNLKHVVLELGGKSPALIFNDANLDNAVAHNSRGFLLNSGQICMAGSRILVQSGIAPKFIEALKAAFIKLNDLLADPALDSTYLGPLADKAQFERVMSYLEGAKKDGIEVLTGGGRKGDRGRFVEPTILMDPDVTAKVYTEEIFGPVVVIKTFETEKEAIEMANNTSYGLGATVYTNDITRALRVTAELEAGTVTVNSFHRLVPETPFGGKKQSGYGREGGFEGIKLFLEAKTVQINMTMPED